MDATHGTDAGSGIDAARDAAVAKDARADTLAMDAHSTDTGGGRDATAGSDAGHAALTGRFLFSTNSQPGRVTIHTIDGTTGQLRFYGFAVVNPSSPSDTTSNVVLSPSGDYLYAADELTSEVYGFSVSPTDGQLTSLGSGQPFGAASLLTTVTAASSGNTFLYAFAGGSLWVAPIDPATGLFGTLGSSTPPGVLTPMVSDPRGRFAYFGTATGILGDAINPGTGALSALAGSPFSAGTSGSSQLIIQMSPNGSFLYAVNPNENKIHSFAVAAAGTLNEVGTAQATGHLAAAVAVDPKSRYVFVSNEVDGTVSPYAIQSNGSLLAGTAVVTGGNPGPLAVDPSSQFLYVADQTGSTSQYTGIQTFGIGAGGKLTAIQAVGEPTVESMVILGGTSGVTYAPQFLFAASEGYGDVSAYQVDPASGALTQVMHSPYTAMGAQPASIATDLLGRFVYAPSAFGNPAAFAAFSVTSSGTSAGQLTSITGMPSTGLDSMGVVVEPSERFVFVSNASSNAISGYSMSPATGLLTELTGSPFTVPNGGGGSPTAIAVSPFGSTLFVTDTSIDTVAALGIVATDSTDGTLSNFTNSPINTGASGPQRPIAVAVDPSNRFVYVANAEGQSIAAYQFNDANEFAPISGTVFILGTPTVGGGPTSLTVEPTGRFLYVALEPASPGGMSAGVLVTYAIDPTTGALSPVGTPGSVSTPPSAGPGATLAGLTADPSGRFLYAALDNESGSPTDSVIVLFDIDPSLGTPTLQTSTAPVPYGTTALTMTASIQ